MRLRLHPWALASTLFLSPAWALAQQSYSYPPCDRTPTDSDVAAAKGAFQAGNASFNEADYQRALTYWEDAYRRDCTAHPLLLNLARAYELDGQPQRAITALETFLARSPDAASQEAPIRRRIDKLREQLAEESTDAPAPTAQTTPTQTSSVSPAATENVTPEPDGPPSSKRPVWPLFLAGGGALLAIGGAIVYIGAASDVSDYEELCGGRQGCPTDTIADEANSARTLRDVSGAVTLVGVGIAATGAVLYLTSKPETQEAKRTRPRVAPAVGPGFAGLQLSGGF